MPTQQIHHIIIFKAAIKNSEINNKILFYPVNDILFINKCAKFFTKNFRSKSFCVATTCGW